MFITGKQDVISISRVPSQKRFSIGEKGERKRFGIGGKYVRNI